MEMIMCLDRKKNKIFPTFKDSIPKYIKSKDVSILYRTDAELATFDDLEPGNVLMDMNSSYYEIQLDEEDKSIYKVIYLGKHMIEGKE